MRSLRLPIAVGLMLWLGAELVAFRLAEVGSGFLSPALFSFSLLILLPLLSFLIMLPNGPRAYGLSIALVAAAVLDALLWRSALVHERYNYELAVNAAPVMIGVWCALWGSWQIMAAVHLLRQVGLPRHATF